MKNQIAAVTGDAQGIGFAVVRKLGAVFDLSGGRATY